MITIEGIRKKMEHMNVSKVAREAGIKPATLHDMLKDGSNPTINNVQKIIDYFERRDAQ